MAETWAARWSGAWAEAASRFNISHAPAGSATGGQFSSGGGSGSGSKGGKPAAGTGHAAPAASASRAERKAHLQEKARTDRAEAHRLTLRLHAMEKQHAAAVHTAANAKKQTAAGKQKHTAKTHKHTSKTQHHAVSHHASLHDRINGLRKRIGDLLAQAKAADAAAARL